MGFPSQIAHPRHGASRSAFGGLSHDIKSVSLTLFNLFWSEPVVYKAPEIVRTVYAEERVEAPVIESLEEMAARLAEPYGLQEKLFNLIESESQWNPNAESKTGDVGLVQINLKYNPEVTREQALDPVYSVKFALYHLLNGEEWRWVVCNCYSLVKTRVKVPKMALLEPNSPPVVGGVAIQDFKGVKHVSYIKKLTEKGVIVFEANYEPCKTGERLIEWSDPFLRGYWAAQGG